MQFRGGALTMHWDGASWTVVPNPSKSSLHAITAISSNDVWAVGDQVIMHWNGANWSQIYNAGSLDQYLHAVVAIAANDVWAFGDNGQTQHWNGAAWSSIAAPYPGIGSRFHGAAAASGSDVWAVGYYHDGSQLRTLIDRYTVP